MDALRAVHGRVALVAWGVAVVLTAAPAFAAAAPGSYEIPLNDMTHSGEHAVAVLKPVGNKTLVTLKTTGGPSDPQPAHFHYGTCEKYTPRPLHMLQSVVNGESTTTLDVPIDQLVKGDLVINVHRSLTDIATVSACGISKPS